MSKETEVAGEPEVVEQERRPADETQGSNVRHTLTPEEHEYIVSGKTLPPPTAPVPGLHVAPNLIDVATGRAETPEEKAQVREVRDLNAAVHSVLIVGLAVSATLMLIGVVEAAALRLPLPTVEPRLGQIVADVLALRPSGFMGLGLLVLVATPILRVVGSILAFASARDWRFTGVTVLVFIIVLSSILIGGG